MVSHPGKRAAPGAVLVQHTRPTCEMVAQEFQDTADITVDRASQEDLAVMMDRSTLPRTAVIPRDGLLSQLTRREREVIELVVRGATDREIARDLGISTNTINEHIMAIKRKIGAANRVSIATLYYGDTPYFVPAEDEGPARNSSIEVAPAYARYARGYISGGRRT